MKLLKASLCSCAVFIGIVLCRERRPAKPTAGRAGEVLDGSVPSCYSVCALWFCGVVYRYSYRNNQ
jgi:hypothetical protein